MEAGPYRNRTICLGGVALRVPSAEAVEVRRPAALEYHGATLVAVSLGPLALDEEAPLASVEESLGRQPACRRLPNADSEHVVPPHVPAEVRAIVEDVGLEARRHAEEA